MNKRIIFFDQFELPHPRHAIYYNVMTCLGEFKLRDKLLSIFLITLVTICRLLVR